MANKEVEPIPEHLHTMTPRIVVGDGSAAITFYERCFGAELVGERFHSPDGELIHAELQIGDSVAMLTEDDVDGPIASPDRVGGLVTCVMATTGATSTKPGSGRSMPAQRSSIRLPTSSTVSVAAGCGTRSDSNG